MILFSLYSSNFNCVNNLINKLSEFKDKNNEAILSVLEKKVFIINKSFSFFWFLHNIYLIISINLFFSISNPLFSR